MSCKSTFFPFDPFSYNPPPPNDPPYKKNSGINKIWYGTYCYTPRYPAGGVYILYVSLPMSASLAAYAIPP
jgi:hypothetical protein